MWYSLEAPHWGASNEYPQNMFLWENKKNITTFQSKKAHYLELWNTLTLNDSSSSLYIGSILAKGAINSTACRGRFESCWMRLSVSTCVMAVCMWPGVYPSVTLARELISKWLLITPPVLMICLLHNTVNKKQVCKQI